ncbi:uncharacterized protein si:dkey-19a16.7 isoform X2 [Danio rerio]
MWYFDDVRIADINAVNNGKTCLNDQCKTRFSDRLKLHQQTGSLIITNTRTTDSGDYKLMITGNDNYSEKIFSVSVSGGAGNGLDEVFVMEGDSVTLLADVRADHDRSVWYYNEIRLAKINGGQSSICTDYQCKKGFGDRLKLDNQTASLTIMNIRETDAGLYKLIKRNSDKIFSVVVCGVPGTQDQIKKNLVRDGESVTINPDRSSAAVARIHFVGAAAAAVLLLVAVVIIIVKWRKTRPYSGAISAVESESS